MPNKLSEEQTEIIRLDKINGEEFEKYLEDIYTEYASYFISQPEGKKIITNYFALIQSGMPPNIRLRYFQSTKLDETIRNQIIAKYKEIFGKYADFMEL